MQASLSSLGALLAALLLCLLVASPTIAQSTGGSFGGGDFGGGGDYSSDDSSSDSGGSSDDDGGGTSIGGLGVRKLWRLVLALVLTGGLIAAMLFASELQARQYRGTSHGARGWRNVDVSVIRLGLDWRARPDVQARMSQLAEHGDTRSKQGLSTLLHRAVALLRAHRVSWLYADVVNHHPMSAASAEGIFRQHTIGARAAFREEVWRSVDGVRIQSAAGTHRALAHEGEGVVVVTIVVAARSEIADVSDPTQAAQLELLLTDLAQIARPETLVAMEVIWSPALEGDRMSTAELEQHYPQLRKIDGASIGGRVFCTYCRGPYPEELGACPHCGAAVL